MGREIVYCDVCGVQIVASDFEKDRALSVNGKNYCQKCRKEAPVPATTAGARAPSSDRVGVKSGQTGSRVLDAITPPPSARNVATPPPRRGGATPPVRRAGGTTRIRKPAPPTAPNRTPLIVGVAIGAVVLLGIIAMMMAGDDPPKDGGGNKNGGSSNTSADNGAATQKPPDVTPKETGDQKIWKQLQAFDRNHPGEPRAVRAKFNEDRRKLTDSKFVKLVDDRIAELDAQIEDLDLDEKLANVIYDINQLTPEEHLPKIVDLLAAAEEHVAGGAERRKRLDTVRRDIKSRLDAILPKRLSETAGWVRDFEADKVYWTAIDLARDLIVFLEAAQTFTDTKTEQGQWTEKLKQLEKLAEGESTPPPDPKPREPEAGPWTTLFDGKLAGWEDLPLDAKGEWGLDGAVMVGKRSKGKGQYGAGYSRQDVVLADFEMEIDIEVVKGTVYIVPRANVGGGNITGGLVTVDPEGGREIIKIRAVDRDLIIESPSSGRITGRLVDQAGDAGGLLLLLGEETEVRIHTIRYRDLR